MRLSVVMPTLNAASTLADAIAAVADADEIIVTDGGSTDTTPRLAAEAGARVLACPRGRGVQLHAGACAAGGDWLLFLHADTRLAPGWRAIIEAHARDFPHKAGVFRFRLDDTSWQARVLERLVALRVALLALPYGDQGLLISRSLYDSLGGYRPLPLMEDVDLIKRLGRRRLHVLASRAVTSAARWRADGWIARSARNVACLALYAVGVPPARLVRLYER